jgi:hypothetical protein
MPALHEGCLHDIARKTGLVQRRAYFIISRFLANSQFLHIAEADD